MSLIPCPNKIGCESDYPVTNYSSEDPDPRSFIGFSTGTAPTSSFPRNQGGGGPRGQGPDGDDTGDGPAGTAQTGTGGDPPPLGSDYDNPIVTTFAVSTESQAKAWDDAGNENVSAMTVPSNTGEPGGGIILNPSRQRPSVFGNDPQSCSVTCPDGQQFTYTVAANIYRQLTKEKANAAALSFACKQAALNQICLGAIASTATVGVLYDQSIIASTANIPVTFILIGGSIPSWLTATVGDDSVQLFGTPAGPDIGVASFTIQATDAFGNTMTRAYTITVSAGAACDPVAVPAAQVFVSNVRMSVFCNKTGTVFAIDNATDTSIFELSTNGIAINSFLVTSDVVGCVFYENVNQRLYVGYRTGLNFRIASYDPSTRTLINLTTLTNGGIGTINLPLRMTYDSVRNKLWVNDGNDFVWVLNANTLSQSVVQFSGLPGSFGSPTGMVFCENQDKVVMLGSINAAGFPLGISVWNPATLSFSSITATGDGNGEDISYNPNNGLVYGITTPDFMVSNAKVLVIDPGDIASYLLVDLPASQFGWATGYNPCTDKVVAVVEQISNGPLKAYYINPSDNSIASTLSLGATLTTSESPMSYDSINARLWMGTGPDLLKFT